MVLTNMVLPFPGGPNSSRPLAGALSPGPYAYAYVQPPPAQEHQDPIPTPAQLIAAQHIQQQVSAALAHLNIQDPSPARGKANTSLPKPCMYLQREGLLHDKDKIEAQVNMSLAEFIAAFLK